MTRKPHYIPLHPHELERYEKAQAEQGPEDDDDDEGDEDTDEDLDAVAGIDKSDAPSRKDYAAGSFDETQHPRQGGKFARKSIGEGPWKSRAQAHAFLRAEVGHPHAKVERHPDKAQGWHITIPED